MNSIKLLDDYIIKLTNLIETFDDKIPTGCDEQVIIQTIIDEHKETKEIMLNYMLDINKILTTKKKKSNNIAETDLIITKDNVNKLLSWCEIMIELEEDYNFFVIDRENDCYFYFDIMYLNRYGKDNPSKMVFDQNFNSIDSILYKNRTIKSQLIICYKIYENYDYKLFVVKMDNCNNINEKNEFIKSIKEYIYNNSVYHPNI